jgi:hypothetical protein
MRAMPPLNIPDLPPLVSASWGQKVFGSDGRFFESTERPPRLSVRLIGRADGRRHRAGYDLLHNVRCRSVLFIPGSTEKGDDFEMPYGKIASISPKDDSACEKHICKSFVASNRLDI